MNIEDEKDLQVWFELYKAILIDSAGATLSDCASLADSAFNEYKKRAKALDGIVQEDEWTDWCGESCSAGYIHPTGGSDVYVVYRDGSKEHGCVDDFSWTHLDDGTDIVKFKYV